MRLLVFSAHSADFCSRAGGTIAKYAASGAQVRVVCLTYGERSESGGLYAGGAKSPERPKRCTSRRTFWIGVISALAIPSKGPRSWPRRSARSGPTRS